MAHAHAETSSHGSASRYLWVWLALMVLTAATYFTGRMHLGALALPLALAIASTKGGLVIVFFMHLLEEKGASKVAILVGFLFVILLIAGTLADVSTRFVLARPTTFPDMQLISEPAAAKDAHGQKAPVPEH